jgi:hypothetical protein
MHPPPSSGRESLSAASAFASVVHAHERVAPCPLWASPLLPPHLPNHLPFAGPTTRPSRGRAVAVQGGRGRRRAARRRARPRQDGADHHRAGGVDPIQAGPEGFDHRPCQPHLQLEGGAPAAPRPLALSPLASRRVRTRLSLLAPPPDRLLLSYDIRREREFCSRPPDRIGVAPAPRRYPDERHTPATGAGIVEL